MLPGMSSAESDAFLLDPDVVFLNHGSFGACPKLVLQRQHELRAQMEREPVHFFMRLLPDLLDAARARLAELVQAEPADLVFVRNATSAVNAVLGSLPLCPGDEVVTTNHVYRACHNALSHHAERHGARVVVATVPFPLRSAQEVIDSVESVLTDRSRVLLLDHVTSPSALIFPIQEIVALAEARGVVTLMDGAHAPGMVPLDLASLGASYYTGNLHKWVCAPKGAAFLFARRDRQAGLHPAVISHGRSSLRSRSRYWEEFDWCGTDDFTPALCVPRALDFLEARAGGLAQLMRDNHQLALTGRDILLRALAQEPAAPDDMLGSMATLPLPMRGPVLGSAFDVDPLQTRLFEDHHVEVPIFSFPQPGARCLRISAQMYNRQADYHALAQALSQLQADAP
jgi:isopenicillin-N epimerase